VLANSEQIFQPAARYSTFIVLPDSVLLIPPGIAVVVVGVLVWRATGRNGPPSLPRL
jgi:hypothetical protein